MIDISLTQDIALQVLSYNPNSGELTWRSRPPEMFKTKRSFSIWNKRYPGKIAGTRAVRGYIHVRILGKNLIAHRLIWLMVFGSWPKGEIDHINGVKTDNRLPNLRLVDRVENSRNAARRINNKSGITGVSWDKALSKWHVRIGFNGKTHHVAYTNCIKEAERLRKEAENRIGFHRNHGREIVSWAPSGRKTKS